VPLLSQMAEHVAATSGPSPFDGIVVPSAASGASSLDGVAPPPEVPFENVETCKRLLYGGRVGVSIPLQWEDMCELRPMPDNQEAFFSGLGEGASLIFEIVERIETDADVAGYFFEDYADACAVTNNVEMNFFARSVERACS